MSPEWMIPIVLVGVMLPMLVFGVGFRKLLFVQSPVTEPAKIVREAGFTPEREQHFIRCVDALRPGASFDVVAGEANPDFWTRRVVESLSAAAKRKVRMRFICGPLIVGVEGQDGTLRSDLLELASSHRIEMFLANRRQPFHFRVTSTGRSYYEEPHSPGERGMRIGYSIPYNEFEAGPLRERFKKLLKSPDVRPVKDSDREFVMVTHDDLSRIVERANEQGKDYNDLTRDELVALLRVEAAPSGSPEHPSEN